MCTQGLMLSAELHTHVHMHAGSSTCIGNVPLAPSSKQGQCTVRAPLPAQRTQHGHSTT